MKHKTVKQQASVLTSRQKGLPHISLKDHSPKADIKNILKHLNLPVSIFDHQNKKFIYVNNMFLQLTGLSHEVCSKHESKNFSDWIHVDDLNILRNKIKNTLHQVYLQSVDSTSSQLNYMVNFRLTEKDMNGEYIHVLAQCSVMEWNKDHFPAVTFNMFNDISNYKNNHKIILTVNMLDKKSLEWKTVIKEEFLREPEMLTNREKEIMAHMNNDASAMTIANSLDMSYHTVRAHWRNILQKTSCKSQKEFKDLAQAKGWL